jgi:aspartate racemase
MNVVGILGGMGPAAGADFVRLFVQACTQHLLRDVQRGGQAVRDQDFPEHWLAQVPVPDRTQALQDAQTGAHQPLEPMLQALGRLAALGARSVAIACNTAHAWHAPLQARFPQIELLHMAQEMAQQLAGQGVREAALMATQGTYQTGLYEKAFAQAGVRCHLPTPAERERIMQGIYQGVKAGNMPLAQQCFSEVARSLVQRHGAVPLVLGCTEIPLGLQMVEGLAAGQLLDPAQVLAQALAQRAYAV